MNFLLIVNLVLVSGFLVGLVSSVEKKYYDRDWWRHFHYQVYATRGKPIPPNETLKLIENLIEEYKDLEDKDTINRRDKVLKLFNASLISNDKCNQQYFNQLDELIVYNSPFKLNVIPYLKAYRDDQMKVCLENFEKNLKNSIDTELDSTTLKNIDNLMSIIVVQANLSPTDEKSNNLMKFQLLSDLKNVARSILKFLNTLAIHLNSTPFLNKGSGFENFETIFRSTVGDLCEHIHRVIEFYLYVYDQNVEQTLNFSSETENWLLNARVCGLITNNIKLLTKGSHNLLLRQNQGPPGILSGINWFGEQVNKHNLMTAPA